MRTSLTLFRCFKSRRAFVLLAALGLSAAVALALSGVFVDDPSVFQLDGDAVQANSNGYTGDDWDNVMNNGGGGNLAILSRTGIVGDFGTGDQIFTGGASKDIGGINDSTNASKDWGWALRSGPPDKDDLTDAYAVAYKIHNTSLNVDQLWAYFGADRFDNSGDALLGFWFFQDSAVGPIGGGRFGGNHTNGDLLVIASFTGGGTIPTVNVEKWSCGTNTGMDCDANGQLVDAVTGVPPTSKTVGVQELCNPSNPILNVCAITNTGGQTVPIITGSLGPWTYHNKSAVTNTNTTGLTTTFPAQTFFEGGINISHFFTSGSTPCFSVFMAETRSSTDFTKSVNKDFVRGNFNTCGIAVSKTCDTVAPINGGTQLQYQTTITVTQTGFGGGSSTLTSVDDVATVMNFSSGQTTTVDIGNGFTDGSGNSDPIPLNTAVTSPYVRFFTAPAGDEATSNVVSITANVAGAAKSASSSSAPCPTLRFDTLTAAKTCMTQLPVVINSTKGTAPGDSTGSTVVAAEVQVTATVCNNDGNQQFDNVSVSDSGTGGLLGFVCASPMLNCTVGNTVTSFSLQPRPAGGTSCATSVGTNYQPTACDSAPTLSQTAGVCSFSDTIMASGTGAINGVVLGSNGVPKPSSTATCHYCPGMNPNFCNAAPTDPITSP